MDNNLLKRMQKVHEICQKDFGGGSPISKCYLMAYLAYYLKLKTYVEIGVYKGKSLFSVAYAFQNNQGKAYGIDPYNFHDAEEHDLPDSTKQIVNDFLKNIDFQKLFEETFLNIEFLGLTETVSLIRQPSHQAVNHFEDFSIDMLHIDGNHDSKNVSLDINTYLPKLKENAIVVFDDIDWNSVRQVYDEYKSIWPVLIETQYFGILIKQEKTLKNIDDLKYLARKLNYTYNKLLIIEKNKAQPCPKVVMAILSCNHEKYIEECLDSVIKQQGNFKLKILIVDNNSIDRTPEIIKTYITKHETQENVEFEFLPSLTHLKKTQILKRIIKKSKNSNFISVINADEYYLLEDRVQQHINFLNEHPECVFSFDGTLTYYQDKGQYDVMRQQQLIDKNILNTADIIDLSNYVIGNLSCCFYDSSYLSQIAKDLFCAHDWSLNIMYSLFGDVGFIKKPMTVCRKYAESNNCNKNLINSITTINSFTNYNYDYFLTKNIHNILSKDDSYKENYDLVIIDNIFPHPLSPFIYQEYTSYLAYFSNIKILATGRAAHLLGKNKLDVLLSDFKKQHPNFSQNVSAFFSLNNISCKLVYFVFLGSAFSMLNLVEKKKIPFVFTLYPGGLFGLDNEDSDKKLERVLKSPCFRRVIVTQKVTYEYLINKKYCAPEQIEFIFGVVTPLNKVEKSFLQKKHFGLDKNILDICFVAHKYTPNGHDKGYDLFVAVAHELAKKYSNIIFHIVGGFNEFDIDVSEIREKIHFYGQQTPEWFNDFYQDKDIILSANVPGMIFKGSFDGFPTASCTEAGLCKTAIFCTDPLQLNDGYFKDREDIVIIKHNVVEAIATIEYYYNNPTELKSIAEKGCETIKKLYGFKSQMTPRINLLEEEISKSFIYEDEMLQQKNNCNNEPDLDTAEKKDNFINQLLSEIVKKDNYIAQLHEDIETKINRINDSSKSHGGIISILREIKKRFGIPS